MHNFTNAGFLKPADFLRLREVSVAWSLPPRMTRTLRASTARLVVAGRNLIMITKRYAGMDPEASSVEDTKWSIPPLRYWIVRLNLGR